MFRDAGSDDVQRSARPRESRSPPPLSFLLSAKNLDETPLYLPSVGEAQVAGADEAKARRCVGSAGWSWLLIGQDASVSQTVTVSHTVTVPNQPSTR